jgi:uncharacterized protein YecT (DUF1311 family)
MVHNSIRDVRALSFSVSLAAGLALVAFAPAQANPVFKPAATDACVTKASAGSENKSDHAVLACVGQSAQACMNTPGGETTVGMMDCLKGELDYWDKKLNAAYAKRLATAKTDDAELKSMGSAAPKTEPALRKMQRAWIAYRDAACLYEQSKWMGGTGGGPATMACHMEETARQALKLDGWWSQ